MLASKPQGALYLGVTSDLVQRVWQHKSGFIEGHASKYNIKLLVWFEGHATIENAIAREKALKRWKRAWKVRLIEDSNPTWGDLYSEVQ